MRMQYLTEQAPVVGLAFEAAGFSVLGGPQTAAGAAGLQGMLWDQGNQMTSLEFFGGGRLSAFGVSSPSREALSTEALVHAGPAPCLPVD